MEGIIGAVGVLGGLALLILAVLTILLPVTVYSAQKYAYKSYIELKGVNGQLKAVSSQLNTMNSQLDTVNESMTFLAEVEAKRLSAGRAREAGQ